MRWIFFSLLIMNAATFVWGVMFEDETPRHTVSVEKDFPYKNVASLGLLGEGVAAIEARPVVRAKRRRSFGSAGVSGEISLPVNVDGKDLCELVGPFKSRDSASRFVERLSAIEIKSAARDLRLPAGDGYWVYIPPKKSRRAALRHLAELQAKKIDSYVIPKGELANGISLGLFSQQDLAKMRLKEMRSIGLDPKIDTIERTYREIWVMLEHKEETKMSRYTWQSVLEGFNKLERRQNFCLDVASEDNIQ